ncbi:MAG: inosine/xanthosine triphosphatase [Nitritalea sp.]
MQFPKRKNITSEHLQKLHIIVGSKNPVKQASVQDGFSQAFLADLLVQGLEVDSGVAEQPFGDADTFQGALNRAQNAKNAFPEADYWVGIEGGVGHIADELEAFAWVVVLNRAGKLGKARTSSFILPLVIQELVEQGMELGQADDQVFQRQHSKQGSGAVGILTKGALTRRTYYSQAVLLACIPFIQSNLYGQ